MATLRFTTQLLLALFCTYLTTARCQVSSLETSACLLGDGVRLMRSIKLNANNVKDAQRESTTTPPYICSLRRQGEKIHRCFGTLVTPRKVLTTTQCVDPHRGDSAGSRPTVVCNPSSRDTNGQRRVFHSVTHTNEEEGNKALGENHGLVLITLDRDAAGPFPHVQKHGFRSNHENEKLIVQTNSATYQLTEEPMRIQKQNLEALLQNSMLGISGAPVFTARSEFNMNSRANDWMEGEESTGSVFCYEGLDEVKRCLYIPGPPVEDYQPQTSEATVKSPSHIDEPVLTSPAVSETAKGVAPKSPATPSPTSASVPKSPETSPISEILEPAVVVLPSSPVPTRSIPFIAPSPPYTRPFIIEHEEAPTEVKPVASVAEVYSMSKVEEPAVYSTGFFESAESLKTKHIPPCPKDLSPVTSRTKTETLARIKRQTIYDKFRTVRTNFCTNFSINTLDEDGNSPLHYAAKFRANNSAWVLCRLNADTEIKNNRGRTPLFEAVAHNAPEVLKILIIFGASTDVEDTNGQSPLVFASKHQYIEIVEILKAADGAKNNLPDQSAYKSKINAWGNMGVEGRKETIPLPVT